MRTKTLLLTAALSVAAAASSMADVFSVNIVGYVNKTIPNGFSMVANPLNGATNTVGALFADAPDGSIVYKFNTATASYSINAKDFGEWGNPNETLVPGEGAFFANAGAPFAVTFVGEVATNSTTIPQGFSIQSSVIPQTGQLDTDLEFPAVDGDIVYRFNNASGSYSISAFDFGEWSLAPVPEIGESFFVSKTSSTPWVRTFNVNQ